MDMDMEMNHILKGGRFGISIHVDKGFRGIRTLGMRFHIQVSSTKQLFNFSSITYKHPFHSVTKTFNQRLSRIMQKKGDTQNLKKKRVEKTSRKKKCEASSYQHFLQGALRLNLVELYSHKDD